MVESNSAWAKINDSFKPPVRWRGRGAVKLALESNRFRSANQKTASTFFVMRLAKCCRRTVGGGQRIEKVTACRSIVML